jgi:hypothetical protein
MASADYMTTAESTRIGAIIAANPLFEGYVDQFILSFLQQYGWLAWLLLAIIVVIVVTAFIQGRTINLFGLEIGPKQSENTVDATQVIGAHQASDKITIYTGPQELSEEQYEKVYQRVKARWEAEHPERKQLAAKLMFTPIDPPERVWEIVRIQWTIDRMLERLPRSGAELVSAELHTELHGLRWETVRSVEGSKVEDADFEKIQVVASDIMRQLDKFFPDNEGKVRR